MLTTLAADHPVNVAVAAIRDGRVAMHPGGHLLLPEGVAWPCATNNVLFVRNFFAPLFDSVLGGCKPCKPDENPNLQRRIVTGQPGIGKSVWGCVHRFAVAAAPAAACC